MVLSILNTITILHAPINLLLLSFLKSNHLKNPTHFRPISLCNVVFKLVTKMIPNRFKMILPHIIDQSQSVFVPNHHITNNALVVFEIFT